MGSFGVQHRDWLIGSGASEPPLVEMKIAEKIFFQIPGRTDVIGRGDRSTWRMEKVFDVLFYY